MHYIEVGIAPAELNTAWKKYCTPKTFGAAFGGNPRGFRHLGRMLCGALGLSGNIADGVVRLAGIV